MGKQLEKLVDQPDWTFFHAASKLACRSIILFLFFALIVILLFVQTMHSLCLWPLVSTTELLQLFFFFFFGFLFKKKRKKIFEYVTWTFSVKITQYACRSLALFFIWCSKSKFNTPLSIIIIMIFFFFKKRTNNYFVNFQNQQWCCHYFSFFSFLSLFHFVDFLFVCFSQFCQTCVRIRG